MICRSVLGTGAALVIPIEEDNHSGDRLSRTVNPLSTLPKPLHTIFTSSKFRTNARLNIAALISAPAYKTSTPFHTASEAIPKPIRLAAHISSGIIVIEVQEDFLNLRFLIEVLHKSRRGSAVLDSLLGQIHTGEGNEVVFPPISARHLFKRRISKRIFQNGSESLPTLLSVITLVGRKFVAHLHPAGAFAPDQECTC